MTTGRINQIATSGSVPPQVREAVGTRDPDVLGGTTRGSHHSPFFFLILLSVYLFIKMKNNNNNLPFHRRRHR